nr:growth/differentiation factor 8-like [Leptinotarsa decemlineata]
MKVFGLYSMLSVIVVTIDVCVANVPAAFQVFYTDSNKDDALENSVDGENNFSATENEFTKLRIEYIKNQILKKLRLKEKPNISVTDLPKPVKEYEHFLPSHDANIQSSFSDDFYGKTTQAIIFPYEDEARCLRTIRFPSACLPFQMPNDIHSVDVNTAELWFHKESDFLDEHNQTFIISEVAHWDTNRSFQKTTPIAIQETSLNEGWLKVDVSYVVKNWLEYKNSPIHAISVVCKTCGMDKYQSPISFRNDLKPFLVIYTHTQQRRSYLHRRQRRSSNCEPGIKECCRESLYISFAEIGWDDWIIQPEGYNAHFCRGSCLTASAMTLSASQHNSILQKVMYGQNRYHDTRPELTPCCAATQFRPLQLVYMHSNKTLTTKLLSNMIVETCGCM